MKKSGIIWFGILVVVAAALIVWGILGSKKTTETQHETLSTRELSMICTTDMATEFHIHPKLRVIIDGKEQVIPANVGITNGCMNPLHTHDATGELHVESPVQRDFTLGDFFAVWHRPFSRTEIFEHKAGPGTDYEIVMTVNGEQSDVYENLVLRDKDQIVIEYKKK